MSNDPLIVKVLVDAKFYQKCLAAYNQLELQKTNKPNESKKVNLEGAGSEPENSDLEGGGIVYHANPEQVSNPDIIPVVKKNPPPSSTIVMEIQEPLIVPQEASSSSVKKTVKKSVKKQSKTVPKPLNSSPKQTVKKSVKKAVEKPLNSMPTFKRPEGAPWYYIGLKD